MQSAYAIIHQAHAGGVNTRAGKVTPGAPLIKVKNVEFLPPRECVLTLEGVVFHVGEFVNKARLNSHSALEPSRLFEKHVLFLWWFGRPAGAVMV